MARTDDNHRVASIIKGLEQRIADLEEQDRETGTPNLLRSLTDQIVVEDTPIEVTETTLETAHWNDFGVGKPSDQTISPPVVSLETTTPEPIVETPNAISVPVAELSAETPAPTLSTPTEGYGEGGYEEGPYGDPTSTDGGETMTDGSGTTTGGYGTVPYGDRSPKGSVFGNPATTGWHTGTWGSYSEGDLIVSSGETHTIATGETETYNSVKVEGTLEADGVLETTE